MALPMAASAGRRGCRRAACPSDWWRSPAARRKRVRPSSTARSSRPTSFATGGRDLAAQRGFEHLAWCHAIFWRDRGSHHGAQARPAAFGPERRRDGDRVYAVRRGAEPAPRARQRGGSALCYLLDSVLSSRGGSRSWTAAGAGSPKDGPSTALAREAEDVLAVLGALDHARLPGWPILRLPSRARGRRGAAIVCPAVTLYEPPIRTANHPFLSVARMDGAGTR